MVESIPAVQLVLERLRRVTLLAGVAGLVVSALGFVVNPAQFFQSYLAAFIWCFGLSLGCLAFSMIHYLGGGRWGAAIGDVLRSGASQFWLLAIMFVPVALGVGYLYSWSNPAVVAADPLLLQKAGWLSVPAWLARAVIYFGVWIVLATTLSRWFQQWDATGAPAIRRRLRNLSGGGMVLLIVTASFAMFDWLMSLEPDWTSTIFGLMTIVGHSLSGLALAIFTLTWLRHWWPVREFASWPLWQDLGSLLLANLIVWAYMSFDQLMLIWVANLNEEIPWYLRRMSNGWEYVGLWIIIAQFAICFLALVQRGTRKSPVALGRVAALLVVSRFIEDVFFVGPEFTPLSIVNHWQDIALMVGLGGIWLTFFARQLGQRLVVLRPAAIFPEHVAAGASRHEPALGAEG